jgi:hypothetical protein
MMREERVKRKILATRRLLEIGERENPKTIRHED